MIRRDGCYQIFLIETRSKNYKNEEWFTASLDHFGSPPGFTASDDCWQRTGVYGTFVEKTAREGLKWIRRRHSDTEFRLVCVHISQMKVKVQE
jgi:hypothetical protein